MLLNRRVLNMDRYNIVFRHNGYNHKIGDNGVYEFTFDKAMEICYYYRNIGVNLFILKLNN